jgi:hypothetical protein
MNNKTCEAIGRLEAWVREYGSRSQPPFLDDLKTVIQTAKNEQRAELMRRIDEAVKALQDITRHEIDNDLADVVEILTGSSPTILEGSEG